MTIETRAREALAGELVPETQADRDAAGRVVEDTWGVAFDQFPLCITLSQAFARHRIAIIRQENEACAVLAELGECRGIIAAAIRNRVETSLAKELDPIDFCGYYEDKPDA